MISCDKFRQTFLPFPTHFYWHATHSHPLILARHFMVISSVEPVLAEYISYHIINLYNISVEGHTPPHATHPFHSFRLTHTRTHTLQIICLLLFVSLSPHFTRFFHYSPFLSLCKQQLALCDRVNRREKSLSLIIFCRWHIHHIGFIHLLEWWKENLNRAYRMNRSEQVREVHVERK